MEEKWYDKSASQTLSLLDTDAVTGLKNKEVRKRLHEDGENDIYPIPKKTFITYIKHLLTDYTSILMLITLLVASVFEEADKFAVMLVILVIYYVIAIITYVRSQKVLENIGITVLPNVKVLRGGRLYMVKQKQLVRGDVFFLSTGDIVPCDARIIASRSLDVLEVNVTSVPHAVHKDENYIEFRDVPPSVQKNMLFASSIITHGNAKCVCCETGADTLVYKLKKNNIAPATEKMAVFDRISNFCRKWTLVMTLFILAVTVLDLFVSSAADHGIFESFMVGLSLSVSSMSEFFTAFAYIILACGIFNAYDRKKDINRGALIKNYSKIDKIRKLTCLIVPDSSFKAGNMSVKKITVSGETFSTDDKKIGKGARNVLRYALISTGLYGSGALISRNQSGNNIYTPEEEAIINCCESCGEYNIDLDKKYPLLQHIPNGNDSNFDTTLFMCDYRFVVAIRGDFRSVLPLCKYYTENSRVFEMTQEKLNELVIEAEKLSRERFRVVAVATKDTVYNNLRRLTACQSEMTFEGFIAFHEPILVEAAKNVARCEDAGIKVIMTSDTVSENNVILGDTLGILTEGKTSATGTEIDGMNEGLFRANLDVCRLYQGMNVSQKRFLVKCLREKGEKVGYLCNKLDEIMLLKESDVGFTESMTLSDNAGKDGVDLEGKSRPIRVSPDDEPSNGCEALKFVSDIVVSEPDKDGFGGFNAVTSAVLASKSIYYNLFRMIKYTMTSQVARIAIVLLSIIFGIQFLTPTQILFCGLIVDFAALIVIAFEKPYPELLKAPNTISDRLRRPFKENMVSVSVGILWSALLLISAVFLKKSGIADSSQICGCVFIGFIISQVMMLIESKREKSIFSKGFSISGALLLTLSVVAVFILISVLSQSFGAIFGIMGITAKSWIFVLITPAALVAVCEIQKFLQK